MTEEENAAVEQPQMVETAEEQQTPQQNVVEPQRKDVDYNWSQANEIMRLQKQRIDELEEYHRRAAVEKPQAQEVDEFDAMDQSEVITISQARKLAEKAAERKGREAAKEMVEKYIKEQTVVSDEQRMRSKFDDYDYVVNTYALPAIKNDPALAYKIQSSKNPAEVAYKLGKLSDEYQEQTMAKETSPRAEKVLKNANRPVSSNAVGAPLKAQADHFAKMSKDEVWTMSQKYARGA